MGGHQHDIAFLEQGAVAARHVHGLDRKSQELLPTKKWIDQQVAQRKILAVLFPGPVKDDLGSAQFRRHVLLFGKCKNLADCRRRQRSRPIFGPRKGVAQELAQEADARPIEAMVKLVAQVVL